MTSTAPRIYRAVVGIALLVQLFLPAKIGSAQENQSLPSQDDVRTGNGLLQNCAPSVRFFDGGSPLTDDERTSGYVCAGYLTGFEEGFDTGVEIMKKKSRYTGSSHLLFCIPPSVPLRQVLRVVVKWLQEHPEDLHLPSSWLVPPALINAFPCK
jgi:Rap1a immunity proteins